MFISGFTIVRNAIKYDYPIVEAISSILPICDEVIVAVGNSDDDTLTLIQSIDSPKIKIIETVWDDSLREGGKVLAVETNKALAAVSKNADWCFYIQGDEVIHETYLPVVTQAMQYYLHDDRIQGLLFKYLHFWGSYRYVADSPSWYRREIRVIRNTGKIQSYKDAQGFRDLYDNKLTVKLIDAFVYHYGYVKPPEIQKEKLLGVAQFWYDKDALDTFQKRLAQFSYEEEIEALAEFKESQPAVMTNRLERYNWQFDFDTNRQNFKLKYRLKRWVEKLTGWRIGEYRNYKLG